MPIAIIFIPSVCVLCAMLTLSAYIIFFLLPIQDEALTVITCKSC